MSIHHEVAEFKAINGNKEYSTKDMLMYLCTKMDKMEEGMDKLHECNTDIRIVIGEDGQRIKWMKRVGAIYGSFTTACLGGLLWLILSRI